VAKQYESRHDRLFYRRAARRRETQAAQRNLLDRRHVKARAVEDLFER
jgi:hypothetical protein